VNRQGPIPLEGSGLVACRVGRLPSPSASDRDAVSADRGLEHCVTLCASARDQSPLSTPTGPRSGSATAEHADFRGGHDGRNAPQPEPAVRMHSGVDQRRMRRRLI
jgi:hypothetical protein